ncbi:MAG: helix-turn-helix domain-containing protein [Deltaproteobacteria bacterium]|nr:helix-turn-helix domain-containing protein [Deltaproteobacteria bacterium]
MKKTTIKNFGGLTYITVTNIPIKQTDFGEVIDMEPRALEKLVSEALIRNKIPVRGAEFRIMKSALGLSNEAIANQLGISRNTVLKWGKEVEKRLPPPYEMLVRVLVAELMGIRLNATIDDLRAASRAKGISLKAA